MTRLSVNINKIATLRNARGNNEPNVLHAALKCEEFGAQGITVHPRPDERHITYKDVEELSATVSTEFNIEGYPSRKFIDMVLKAKPTQVTLVPDAPDVLTSNAGWDTIKTQHFLTEVVAEFKRNSIRTSLFIGTELPFFGAAKKCGADRIELYTEPFAAGFHSDREKAIKPFITAANEASKVGLGINAGHDLNLDNLNYFAEKIPNLLEVSIGHALISDALYLGLEKTIKLYLESLVIA